jgi:hypothetical protein
MWLLKGKSKAAFLARSTPVPPISEERLMSTAAVSSIPISQQLQQYFQTRRSDLQQLGRALEQGNLAGAQAAYNKIVQLGQNGPKANGDPFLISQREQDFQAIGQALQAGDLAGAQQAFAALRGSAEKQARSGGGPGGTLAQPASGSAGNSGPEIILNLSGAGGSSTPEQITINITNSAHGGEQVSLSVGTQGSTTPELTLNLAPNTNEQIVLNLLGGAPSTGSSSGSASSSSAGGGLSVTA